MFRSTRTGRACLLIMALSAAWLFAKPAVPPGAAAREAKAKVVKLLEGILITATNKESWIEALEVLRILKALEPGNPEATSMTTPLLDAFIDSTLKETRSTATKALGRLREDYLKNLKDTMKQAQKKKDGIGILEWSSPERHRFTFLDPPWLNEYTRASLRAKPQE